MAKERGSSGSQASGAVLIGAVLTLVCFGALLGTLYSRHNSQLISEERDISTNVLHAAVKIFKHSKCQVRVSTPNAPASFGGLLAEPYKKTSFVVSYACPMSVQQVVRSEGPDGLVSFSSEPEFNFTQTGIGRLKIQICPKVYATADPSKGGEWCRQDSLLQGRELLTEPPEELIFEVTVVYVRREIRDMAPEDRAAWIDAIKVMANTSTEDGQARYGAAFRSYQEMVAKHAATVYHQPGECDYGHFGPAFITYHRAYILEFEKATQAVYPWLSTPYWDYLTDARDLKDISKSPVFGPDYFGSAHGDPKDNFIVKDGPFAYWKVPHGEEAEFWATRTWNQLGPSNMINPYGYLRGKDNLANWPYMARIAGTQMPLSTIEDWKRCQNVSSVGEYVACLDYSSTHPWPHLIIGGMGGKPGFPDVANMLNCSHLPGKQCPMTYASVTARATAFRTTQYKEGCIRCDKRCTRLDQPMEECACECVEEYPRCDPKHMFTRTLRKFYLAEAMPDFMEPKFDWAAFGLCPKPQTYGEMFDLAVASHDPIFWPHHTNVDRLTTSWRKVHPGNWEDKGFTYPSKDNNKYPDYLSVKNILNESDPYPDVFPPGNHNPSGFCPGHGLYDELLKGGFVGVFKNLPSSHPHTNLEVLTTFDDEILSPHAADYIYDQYEA
eukprot:jgi/Mesen1/1929/ME000146S01009